MENTTVEISSVSSSVASSVSSVRRDTEENTHTHIVTRRRTVSDARRRIASILTVVTPENNKLDSRTLKVGNLGRGFNVLDCTVKSHLFDELKAVYIEDKSNNEKLHFFKTNFDFTKEVASRVGIPDVEVGMFSICSELRETFPFLTDIEKLENYQHFIVESEETMYTLQMKLPGASQLNFILDEDVQFVQQHIFTKDTKKQYYAVIEKFGTHYIKQATFGAKAEIRWSLPEKTDKDALDKITSLQNHKKKLSAALENWKQSKFSSDFKSNENLPKNCLESRRITDNFLLENEVDKAHNAYQLRFQLEEISNLFSGQTKISMETAIRVYLEEMRPRSSANDIKEEDIVCLYLPELSKYVRVDDHGHLFADNSRSIKAENKFKIKKKGNRIALKSLKYKEKFLSKALISSIFHFHRLQFMGPHESWEIFEDYAKACGNLSGSSFVYVDPQDSQLHHDGSLKKKHKLIVLNVAPRSIGLSEDIAEEEPLFTEDDYTEDILEVKVETVNQAGVSNAKLPLKEINLAQALLKQRGKELTKSNSTSSLFIKDTVLLPNIDELTRCMAIRVHSLILIGKSDISTNGRVLDIFSEDRYPLTKSPNTTTIPSVEAIFHFFNTIFKVAKLSAEAGIMAVIYIDRLIKKTRVKLNPENWRRLTLSTLMLASKVWEDQAVWNIDFIELFPSINVKELNRLEQGLLSFLEFAVSVKAGEYVKVFFELRENSSMCVDRSTAVRPIDESDLKRLEIRTANSEKEYEQQHLRFHKSSSMSLPGEHQPQPGFAILS